MTDIAQLGIQVDSRTAIRAVDDLQDLTVAATRADAAVENLGGASRNMGAGAAMAGNNARMMAMQLSQVAQQTSATGNFVQALAIQLPDMAMGFGAVGIGAGILASVALPALASAFMSGSSGADALVEAMDALDDSVAAFAAAVEAANAPTEDLIEKYGRLASTARSALEAMTEVQFVEALNATNAAIEAVLDSLTVYRDFASSDLFGPTESVMMLRDSFGLAHQEAATLRQALEDLSNARTLEQQAVAAVAVQRALMGAYGSVQAMPAPLQEAYSQMADIAVGASQANAEFGKMPGLLSSAASAAGSVAAAVSGIAGAAQNAAGSVANLAATLWEAARAKAAAAIDVENGAGGLAAQYGMYGQGRMAGERLARESGALYTPFRTGGGGGGSGGGGGGSDTYSPRLQALVEELRSEREIEDEWYQENLTILNDRRAAEILGAQAHKEALVALEVEYQSRIAAIEAGAQQRRLSDTANLFGSLADIASTGGAKAAKAVATFQAIEGTINAYGAAIKALNTPGITLAGRFAAYASVLAAGLKGVAAIRSAGGVGGGSAGGGAVAAQGGATQAAQSELVIRGLGRDKTYTGAEIEMILDGVLGAIDRRGGRTSVLFA